MTTEREYKKLSTLLRAQIGVTPQIQGALMNDEGVCANGAIYTSITGKMPENISINTMIGAIYGATGIILWAKQPALGGGNFATEITDRNDRGETFEQIATWLESINF